MKYVDPIRERVKIEDMKEVLLMKGKRDYFLFVLGINTGLRISDILKLKKRDIKFNEIRLKESKTKKGFILSLDHIKEEVDSYIQHLEDDDYLFLSRTGGKPISRTQAYRIINHAGDLVGLRNIGCHSLRKTFGYHHYKNHKDIAILMKIFNHSSADVTMRYLGLTEDIINESMRTFKL